MNRDEFLRKLARDLVGQSGLTDGQRIHRMRRGAALYDEAAREGAALAKTSELMFGDVFGLNRGVGGRLREIAEELDELRGELRKVMPDWEEVLGF